MVTMEVADILRSAHLTTKSLWLPSALNVVKDVVVNVMRGLIVDVVEDVAIEDAAGGLLKPLAELISMPSLGL
jgi:hypothetical protein